MNSATVVKPRPSTVVDGRRWCRICDTFKPIESFYKNESRSSGRSDYCGQCDNIAKRNYAKGIKRIGAVVKSDMDRFMESVIPEPMSGCWLWLGRLSPMKYGVFSVKRDGKWWNMIANRWIMKQIHGDFGPEIFACHKCDLPCCVNPQHLFLGTAVDNMADCRLKGRLNNESKGRKKTHCLRGHPLSGENLYVYPNTGTSGCRECMRMHNRSRDRGAKRIK